MFFSKDLHGYTPWSTLFSPAGHIFWGVKVTSLISLKINFKLSREGKTLLLYDDSILTFLNCFTLLLSGIHECFFCFFMDGIAAFSKGSLSTYKSINSLSKTHTLVHFSTYDRRTGCWTVLDRVSCELLSMVGKNFSVWMSFWLWWHVGWVEPVVMSLRTMRT